MKEFTERLRRRSLANSVLRAYTLMIVSLTCWAWLAYGHSGGDPMLRPIFYLADRGHDLTNYSGKIAQLRLGAGALGRGMPIFNYLAPAAYVYKFFLGLFPAHPLLAYSTFLVLAITALVMVAWRSGHRDGGRLEWAGPAILVTAGLGCPLWFTMDRGNIEGVVWALTAAAVCLLLGKRWAWAAITLGAATCIKPFPGLFFLVFLAHKKYKEASLGICVAGVLVLAALVSLGPNPVRASRDLSVNVSQYFDTRANHYLEPTEVRFDHSLLDGMKSLRVIAASRTLESRRLEARQREFSDYKWPASGTVRLYGPVTATAFVLLCLLFYRKPILNQLIAVSVAATILPLSAAEYTLLYLYVPAGAFILTFVKDADGECARISPRVAAGFLLIFGLLLTPITELRLLTGDVQLILLLILAGMAGCIPLTSQWDGDRQKEALAIQDSDAARVAR